MSAPTPGDPVIEDDMESVVVRRSPRYLRFIVLGAIVGAVIALILTFAFPPNPDYTPIQTFGFLTLLSGPVFGVLGAVVALVLDARARRSSVRMEHESSHLPEVIEDAEPAMAEPAIAEPAAAVDDEESSSTQEKQD